MTFCRIYLISVILVGVVADVQDDFSYLVSIFQGTYDNYDQYKSDMNLPPKDRHLHLTTSVTGQDVPALPGRSSFYLEQYLNGSQQDLIRQRIYSFAIDPRKRINLKLYSLVDQAKFAHAKPYSPLFANLTMKDVVYAKGCDVYWTRVSDDLFKTNMFNTCIVPIAGAEVLIIDESTLSSHYLTADETWVFVKNGTVMKVYPGPYNMTRQVPSKEKSTSQLVGYDMIINTMTSGIPIRYYIQASDCLATGNNHSEIGGIIDAFEAFTDPKFGPIPYFGFSSFFMRRDAEGKLKIHLREVKVYKNTKVEVTLTSLSPDYQTVLDIKNLSCYIGQDSESGSAFFYAGDASVTQIKDFKNFTSALQRGANVRFTANWEMCSLGVGAIGGGRIADYDLSKDGSIVESSQYKLITNYQGQGYVEDIVGGSFFSNGSAIFVASNVKVNTDKSFYIEEIDCVIDGMKKNGSVFLYLVD